MYSSWSDAWATRHATTNAAIIELDSSIDTCTIPAGGEGDYAWDMSNTVLRDRAINTATVPQSVDVYDFFADLNVIEDLEINGYNTYSSMINTSDNSSYTLIMRNAGYNDLNGMGLISLTTNSMAYIMMYEGSYVYNDDGYCLQADDIVLFDKDVQRVLH